MARGRRPTEEVRRDVLAAAGELLLAEGVRGFTVEEVARRSGASKMTIYKLWPSKGTLALEGYFTTVESALEFPDTGDVEADLRHQLHAFVSLLTATKAGPTMAELIGLAQTDPELRAAFLRTYSSPVANSRCSGWRKPWPRASSAMASIPRAWSTNSGEPATTGFDPGPADRPRLRRHLDRQSVQRHQSPGLPAPPRGIAPTLNSRGPSPGVIEDPKASRGYARTATPNVRSPSRPQGPRLALALVAAPNAPSCAPCWLRHGGARSVTRGTRYRWRLAEFPTVIRIITALEFCRLGW